MTTTKKAPRSISIEALLIWTYRDQRAGDEFTGLHESEMQADGGTWQGRSGDGVAMLIDRARLGCRIDGGGFAGTATPRLHPDAELVDAWVRALGDDVARMVIRYAKVGEKPYVPPLPKMEPLRWGADGDGEVEMVPRAFLGPAPRTERDSAGRFYRGEGCVGDGRMRIRRWPFGRGFVEIDVRWTPIIQRPSAAYVGRCLDEYWRWWEVLAALRELLSEAGLRDHSLTDEAPPSIARGLDAPDEI